MLSTPPCIGQPTSSPALPENPNEVVTSSSAQDRIVHHGGLGHLRATLWWPAVASAKAGGRRGGIPKRRMTSPILVAASTGCGPCCTGLDLRVLCGQVL